MDRHTIKQPWILGAMFGVLAVVGRLAFVFRYDLNYETESGLRYLMAKRILHGEFPTFFWESDYMGTTPQYVTAAFFAVFGPSIELSAFVSLLAYGTAVALGVWYVQKYMGRGYALGAGLFLAVGFPYLIHYCVQPPGSGYDFAMLIPPAFLWVAMVIYDDGWNFWRAAGAGLLVGHCWYYNKHTLVAVSAVLIGFLAVKRGRALLRQLFTSRLLWVFAVMFLVGDLPEIIYKLNHEPKHELFGVASPEGMVHNLYWVARALPGLFRRRSFVAVAGRGALSAA